MLRRFAPLAALVAAGACFSDWKEIDDCREDGCTVCKSDADCVTGSSCCSEELYCSHRDDTRVVCQLGCDVPEAPRCACTEGRCRFE